MDRSYFTSRPPQFWQSDENVKKFFAWASEFIGALHDSTLSHFERYRLFLISLVYYFVSDLFRYNLGIKNASEWSSVNPIRIESLSGKGIV